MNSADSMQWIESSNLLEKAKQASSVLNKVLVNCLGAKKGDDVLVIGDTGTENNKISAIISAGYHLSAKELGLNSALVLQSAKYKGDRADKEVDDILYRLRQKSIVIMSLSNRMGTIESVGKSFREYAKANKHRFVSTSNLGELNESDFQSVLDSIDADYAELQKKGNEIKNILDSGKFIHVKTDAGTDLRIGIEGSKAIVNAGDYRADCSGGNIPSGEVYLAPKWSEVNGTAVIDGSSANQHGTMLIKEPITLTIKKGELTEIKGGEEAKKLKESLDWACRKSKQPGNVKRVCELGIGINPKAKIIGATIVDEKTVGTAHIAFGSNYWFGGTIYSIIHFDQIFKNPKILVDGKELKI